MKKLILSFLMIFIVYANEISEHKTFIQNVKSNILSTTLKIEVQNKNIAKLTTQINHILNIVNNYKFCKNNTYSILPKYKNQKFMTYYSNLNFKCEFNQNKLSIFSQLLNKVNNNVISIYNFQYTLTKNLYNKVKNNLKIKAFKYGINKAKKLSNTFNQKCFMKSINFSNSIYLNKTFNTFKHTISLPTPKNNNKTVNLNVNYIFICFE